MTDEKRLLDDPTIDAALRSALEAGRAEVPSADRLAAIAAKLPSVPTGPGGGGGGGGGAPPPLPLNGLPVAAKLLIAGAGIAAAVGLGAVAMSSGSTPATPASVPTLSSTNVVPSAASVTAPLPSASVAPSAATKPAFVPVPSVSAAPPPDPALDTSLVEEASRLVATQPDAALAKCTEHEKLFPKSSLAEERDRIAIEALVHLHRDGEARTRAAAFAKRFPGSAYQRRIDALFGD